MSWTVSFSGHVSLTPFLSLTLTVSLSISLALSRTHELSLAPTLARTYTDLKYRFTVKLNIYAKSNFFHAVGKDARVGSVHL